MKPPSGNKQCVLILRGSHHDNWCFSLPQPTKVRAWLGALHAHSNISWSVAQHQLAHKLINPTCLTTTRQALHQRRSVALVKGQCFSNGQGAEAWTEHGGNNSKQRRRCLSWEGFHTQSRTHTPLVTKQTALLMGFHWECLLCISFTCILFLVLSYLMKIDAKRRHKLMPFKL